jgi:tetratricopeptide (TPR) repeat protein
MAAAEAKEHEKLAEKALQTSWLSMRFQPDFVIASMEYSQAATKYRAAGLLADCVRAHFKCAELKEKQNDLFSAGRSYEQAAQICETKPEAGSPEAYWVMAIRCYRLSGKGEAAAKLVMKQAAISEKDGDLTKARELYAEAIEIYRDEEKDYMMSDVYKQNIAFLVRSEFFSDALVAMDGHIEVLIKQGHLPFANKEILAKCVVCLWMGDTVTAEQALHGNDKMKDWFMSDEAQAGFELLAAFQNYDAEAAEQALKRQVFTFLQVEVARIARKLRVPTVSVPPPALVAPATLPQTLEGGLDEQSEEVQETPEPSAQNLGELLM